MATIGKVYQEMMKQKWQLVLERYQGEIGKTKPERMQALLNKLFCKELAQVMAEAQTGLLKYVEAHYNKAFASAKTEEKETLRKNAEKVLTEIRTYFGRPI